MIKKYPTVASVINDLGDRMVPHSKCQVCEREDVTVYPLLSLMACATCIVVQTSGRN